MSWAVPLYTDRPSSSPVQLLEELRRSPACGAARPGQRCCALSAEASAGRCYCRPGDYLGIGTALASMQVRHPRHLPPFLRAENLHVSPGCEPGQSGRCALLVLAG